MDDEIDYRDRADRYYETYGVRYDLSFETYRWLSGWLSGGREITDLPDTVVSELMKYSTEDVVTLYRAPQIIPKSLSKTRVLYTDAKPSSWTYSREMASRFITDDNIPIITLSVTASSVLIDTTRIDATYITKVLGGFPDELEVILLPGTYICNISP